MQKARYKVVEWHALSEKEVLRLLQTSEEGLSEDEVRKRLQIYGKNELKEIHKIRPFSIFIAQFKSFFVYLLIVAAIICIALGHFLDFYAIMAIVMLNACLGFVQNYKAEKAIENLKKSLRLKAKVIREGVAHNIDSAEIVPGDLILLEEGDKVCADARIIESYDLQCNEAVLTGESMPVS